MPSWLARLSVHAEYRNEHDAQIATNKIAPRTNHAAAMAQAFFHFSASAIRSRGNWRLILLLETICKIDIAPRTGSTSGAENLVRNKPDKLSAAINNLAGVIF